MSLYRYAVNLKAGLFGLGIIIVMSLLWYTQSLVAELESNERKLLDFYARLIAKVASEEQSGDLGFVFDAVIQQIQFPIVVTTNDGQAVSWRNVSMDTTETADEQQAYLAEIIRRMDRKREPIDVRYGQLVISYIHYGDSATVSRLRWLPYVEIAVAGLFILVGFAGFSMIRNSEKRSIWVGLAREMAQSIERSDHIEPEQDEAFYAAWVEDLVGRAVEALATEYYACGKGDYVRVLYGRLCRGLSMAEVAESLGIKPTDVDNFFRHAKKRLGEKFEESLRRHVTRYCPGEETDEEFAVEWSRLGQYLADHGGLEDAVRRTFDLLDPMVIEPDRRPALTRAITRVTSIVAPKDDS